MREKMRYSAFILCTVFLLSAVLIIPSSVLAWDFNVNPLSSHNHVDISTSDGGGYYVGFRCAGGGLNALHITSSTSSPYGQVTTVSGDSGTFYLADTGGRGYFDRAVLMVAIKNPQGDSEISDDLKINIMASGYRWTSKGVQNQPPGESDILYAHNCLDRSYGLSSVKYGPQSCKPAGEADHPIMYGQSDSDEFYIFFVDTGVGILGRNSGISGLKDNGMARIDYNIENYNGETVVFNVYGYALCANAVKDGIAWTNKIEGTDTDKNSHTSSSGYTVNPGYSEGSGEFGPSNKTSGIAAIDYGSVSYTSGKSWRPRIGNLNITSIPEGAQIFIDGMDTGRITNSSFEDIPEGIYSVRLMMDEYETTSDASVTVKNGFLTTRNFNLTPAKGSCRFESVPSGADIYIGGKDTLWHTNCTLDDILSGVHRIEISKDGYKPLFCNITINTCETPFIFADLSEGAIDCDQTSGFTGFDKAGPGLGNASCTSEVLAECNISPESKSYSGITGLYITSYPEGLPIILDGRNSGCCTPHLFYGLKPGWHQIKLSSAPGNSVQAENPVDISKKKYLSSGHITSERFTPEDFKDGVCVTIDSKKFKFGSFLVSGEMPEYSFPSKVPVNSFRDYITLKADDRYYSKSLTNNYAGKKYEFEDSNIFGKVEFLSTPPGAQIFIDGYDSGKTTPAVIDAISEGTHNIEITKDGYYPYSEEIVVIDTNHDIDKTVRAKLQDYAYGRLLINSTPLDAKIYLGSVYTGLCTPYEFNYMPIGTYKIGLMYNRSLFKETGATVMPYEVSGVTVVDEELI